LAERRLKRGSNQRHRLRHVWLVLGGLIATAGLWYSAPGVLGRLEFFRIRRVEIAGTQYLAPADIIAALGLDERASIFDDLPAAAQELRTLPGVRSAEVRSRLPGTLEVVVEEAVPVALAPRGAALKMVDSSGSVLPFDPIATAPDLPIAANVDPTVARVLASVRASEPTLFGRVETARRVQDDVFLELDGGRRIRLGPAVTAEDIRAVWAVAEDLARQGRKYAELDGRFDGQVIVRWADT
jgi:cell division septal protein FtsQ